MPFDISWYKDGHIIYIEYYGDVTLEDKQLGAEAECAYLDQATVPLVHVLLDMTNQMSSPTDIKEIQKALDKALIHPKKGWTLAFGKDDFGMDTFVNSVVTQARSARYRTFVTFEETLEFLVYVDSSLSELIDENSD